MTIADRADRQKATSAPPCRRIPGWAGWAVGLGVFLLLLPVLSWFDFSNGIESIHAATVTEIRRGGPWLVPTLNDRPRIAKPPLPAWIGALSVTDATMAGIASGDPAVRASAYQRLHFEVRWSAVLAGCLMLVATFDLASTIGGKRVGLAAAMTAGTSLLFLRYGRLATTDVYLALFVTVANAMFARAFLRAQYWCGLTAAGAALGLAAMCKGPVCLVQTVLPVAAWLLLRRRRDAVPGGPDCGAAVPAAIAGETPAPQNTGSRPAVLIPSLLCVLAFLLIAVPWPAVVLHELPGAIKLWKAEITREGATDHTYAPVWSYLSLLPNLLPWLPVFVLGVGLSLRHWGPIFVDAWAARRVRFTTVRRLVRAASAHRGYFFAFLLLAVPLIVMSLPRDKNERYLLPILPAAAIFCGRGILATWAFVRRGLLQRTSKAIGGWLVVQVVTVIVVIAALPVAALIPGVLKRIDGPAWFSRPLAIGALVVAIGLALFIWRLRTRRLDGALALSAIGILLANILFTWGYKDDLSGRSDMRPVAERIRDKYPSAVVAYYDPVGKKPLEADLLVYLNRTVQTPKRLPATRPSDGPLSPPSVVVMLQREKEKPPTLNGWQSFAKVPCRKRFWHALEPASPNNQ